MSPGPLDVLFVGVLPPHLGGSAISAGQIMTGLAGRGHVIRAVAPITEEAVRAGDVFARRHPELTITRFGVPYFNVSPTVPAPEPYRRLEDDRVQRLVSALLEARRPDVIFLGRETYAACVAPIATRWRLPFLLRLAGGTTHGILDGQYPPELETATLDGYRASAAAVSPSRHLADLVRACGVGRVVVIPTAIDLDRFTPRPRDDRLLQDLGIPAGAVVIAHVSNLKPVKRPLDLVQSAVETTRRDARLTYLIIGDGPLRKRMEEACRQAGVRDRFRFAGWIDYAAMPGYLSVVDLVVMPSESEGLARAYVETQASGRTLLASDIPAAREVVVDGQTGVLFRLGDVADLTAKTLRLAAAPDLRATIGQKARARVGGHALDGALEAYERVLYAVTRQSLNGA